MAQLDDIVGSVMKYLKDNGLDQNTIIGFTTDNGTENFSWPDGGQTPFAGGKGTVMEGGFRAPMILRWPGKVPAGKTENGIVSGLDWFPTLAAAAGYQGDIVADLKKGKQLGDSTYKVHLDGYNQMDLITGKGKSARREVFYLPRAPSVRYASATSSTGLLTSRAVGWAVRLRSIGQSSSISVWIHLSEPD
jgi:arylsulfatase A-like enzyme